MDNGWETSCGEDIEYDIRELCVKERGPICCGRVLEGQNEKKGITGALRTDHGQRPEEKAGKVDFGQPGARRGRLIKAASDFIPV